MKRFVIRTITMSEEYFEFLNELIRMGFADNVSQAIRRCVDVVNGYFEFLNELRARGEASPEDVELARGFLMFLVSKSRLRKSIAEPSVEAPAAAPSERAISAEGEPSVESSSQGSPPPSKPT